MEQLLPELLKEGGLFALAALAILALNYVWKERQKETEQRVQEERADKLRLSDVLEANTKAITELIVLVRELRTIVESQFRH